MIKVAENVANNVCLHFLYPKVSHLLLINAHQGSELYVAGRPVGVFSSSTSMNVFLMITLSLPVESDKKKNILSK